MGNDRPNHLRFKLIIMKKQLIWTCSQGGGCLLAIVYLLSSSIYLSAEESPIPNSEPEEEHGFSKKLMDFAMQDYMLGTWGGRRTALMDKGIDMEFLYFGANPRNMHGGIETGNAYQGVFWGLIDVDTEKLINHPGGHFRYGTVYIHGEDHFSDNHIGDFNKVSTLDFPGAFRLLHLWYEQEFMNDKMAVKFGQMTVDEDFIVPEYYSSMASMSFLNQTMFFPTLAFNLWDIPGYPKGHHALPSIPYGALGVRIRYDPTDKIVVQAAVYDGQPDLTSTYVDWDLSSSQGALGYFEIAYKMNQATNEPGLPGNLKLGGYVHTDNFSDNENVIKSFVGLTSGTKTHSPNYGGYFLADQTLYLEQGKADPARQGLAGMFRLTGAPKDRNLTTFGIDGGLVYKGPIPGRDWDSIGIAASYLELSSDIKDAQKDVNGLVPGLFSPVDYEGMVELTYRAQLTAWWSAHASLQRVIHPGGKSQGNIPDAWAFVLMTTLRL